MVSWFRKDLTCTGAALFRGPLAPRPEELDGLRAPGLEVTLRDPRPECEWELELRHPQWGRAAVFCPRGAPLPPAELIDWDPRLSQKEKEEASVYGSCVFVRAEPQTHDVLQDRKILLRFLRAVLGSHGLIAMDHVAQSCWSKAALEDELRHDAALDIAALYTVHMVHDEGREVFWLHSHGLREIGFFDFDVIEPHASSYRVGYDCLRAVAFAVVEGRLVVDGGAFDLVHPGGSIEAVSARRFRDEAAAGEWGRWRQSLDDDHVRGHAILCDPEARSWFGFGSRRPPRPSRFFSAEFPDEGVIHFSTEATALMAARARNTYATFRALILELAQFQLPALVKLGYPVDGGGEDEREHLWFEVHACHDRSIEATLVNQPFHVARLRPGDRGAHAVDLISDWTIMSPFGSITPAFGMALREVRSRPDELRRVLAESRD